MAKFDTVNDASWVLLGKLTLSGTSTVTTALVDMQGYDALDVAFLNGTVTDAGTVAGFTSKRQESDLTTAASFTDVAAANGVNAAVTRAHDERFVGVAHSSVERGAGDRLSAGSARA